MLGNGSQEFGEEEPLDNCSGEEQRESEPTNLSKHFHSFYWQNGSEKGSFPRPFGFIV